MSDLKSVPLEQGTSKISLRLESLYYLGLTWNLSSKVLKTNVRFEIKKGTYNISLKLES